jgi:hypothetical protein
MEIIIHLGEAMWQYHMPTLHNQFDHWSNQHFVNLIMQRRNHVLIHGINKGVTHGSQLSTT